MPLIEEEIDGLSGLLFPFYDADTHMLYLAGKVVKGRGRGGTPGETLCPSGQEPAKCLWVPGALGSPPIESDTGSY